jgi:hypothetical protein
MRPSLSVSTDRIALPAVRAAALLSRLPERVARDGSGVVVEVYPAAALSRWALASQGYKGKAKRATRQALVEDFLARTEPRLRINPAHVDLCISSDDAFDAVIVGPVARAAAIGMVEKIPDADRAAAEREGWIAVPLVDSLEKLAADRKRRRSHLLRAGPTLEGERVGDVAADEGCQHRRRAAEDVDHYDDYGDAPVRLHEEADRLWSP